MRSMPKACISKWHPIQGLGMTLFEVEPLYFTLCLIWVGSLHQSISIWSALFMSSRALLVLTQVCNKLLSCLHEMPSSKADWIKKWNMGAVVGSSYKTTGKRAITIRMVDWKRKAYCKRKSRENASELFFNRSLRKRIYKALSESPDLTTKNPEF